MSQRFRDRRQAGRILAQRLTRYARRDDVFVLALPRGGVSVGFEVARALEAPLDVYMVRKLSVPGYGELAMGAVAPGGVRLINWESVRRFGIGREALSAVIFREETELAHREQLYRHNAPRLLVTDCTVLLVDDGIATGATMRVVISALRQQQPARIVVAVPIAARSTCESLACVADEIVCAATPEEFHAVGAWYQDFAQPKDEEVRALLQSIARDQERRDSGMPAAYGHS
ncbi:MAG TPA: phosphoribosyltransferase [Polyangiaceae bacterium]|jgi:predicted phosphoribosyltransferase